RLPHQLSEAGGLHGYRVTPGAEIEHRVMAGFARGRRAGCVCRKIRDRDLRAVYGASGRISHLPADGCAKLLGCDQPGDGQKASHRHTYSSERGNGIFHSGIHWGDPPFERGHPEPAESVGTVLELPVLSLSASVADIDRSAEPQNPLGPRS